MEPTSEQVQQFQIQQRARNGSNWFYWIAGLSLVTSIVHLTGSQWGFIASLGITQVFDGIGATMGAGGKTVAMILDLFAAVAFIGLGYFARRHTAAWIIGMSLYALDSLIFVWIQEWIGIAFHAFVLFSIFSGFKAFKQLAPPQPAGEPRPEPIQP